MLRRKIDKALLKVLGLALVSLCTLSACYINTIEEPSEDASGNFRVVEAFSFTAEIVSQGRVEVWGINGPIDVVGVPSASKAEIWGERRVTSKSTEDARDFLRQVQVRFDAGSMTNAIFVKTEQPAETHGRKVEVIYHLRVPNHLDAMVNNANGNVRIDSLAGHVSVELANGNIQLREFFGNMAVRLTNGNVTLTNFTGSMFTFISLVNGNIDAGLTLPHQAECELRTVNGTIGLRIPQNTSAQFSAEVTNGTINTTGLVIFDSSTTPKSVRGRLANGEGKITLKTTNGSIGVTGL
ncbi:DUF4097 family beta strand repeat-containing protein [candidate division KSB1 bacterium]|nr:DUF4097 family beta strand repeat-containing protein [candidate division KSB1 bacterium]